MSNDSDKTTNIAIWIARVIPLPALIGGAVMLYFGVKEIHLARESVNWPSAEGTIHSSTVKWNEHSESVNNSFSAEVQYRYIVNGLLLWGNDIAFGALPSSYTSAGDIVNRYPSGTTVKVYYRPNDPGVCVLEPGVQYGTFWGIPSVGLFLFLCGIGLAIIYSTKAIRRRAGHIRQGAETPLKVVACSNPPRSIRIRRDGQALELTPCINRRAAFAGSAAVLLTPILFMYFGFAIEDVPIFCGVLGIVLLPICLAFSASVVFASETIRLEEGKIEILRYSLWSGVVKCNVCSSDIKEVTVTPHESNWTVAIAVHDDATSEEMSISFGSHSAMSFETAEWIRNCILQALATVATQHKTKSG